MANRTLGEIAEKMRDIDFTVLITHGLSGALNGRPMSNNREVDYEGDSYFFTWAQSRMVEDITRNPEVALSLQGDKHLLGKPGIHILVQGAAEIVRDKQAFREHWRKDLDRWFEEGVDTPTLVMIKVRARRVHYWDGTDEAEILVG